MSSSSSSSLSSSFEEERARMYAQLFDCSCNNNNNNINTNSKQQQEQDQILGFQNRQVLRGAQALKDAVDLKRKNNNKRKQAAAENDEEEHDHKIILAYTSNIVSSGLRECIAALIADGAVDAVVTTAGGIEEDLIKCLGPTLVGDFTLEGASLRDKGLNRIGNLLVPNNNYVLFESFFRAVLHQHLRSQTESNCAPEHCAPSDILKSSGEYLTKIEQLVEAHYANKQQLRSSSSSSSAAASTQRSESAEDLRQQTPLSNNSNVLVDSGVATNNDDGFSEHLGDIDLAILKQQLRYSVAYQAWKHDVPILCPAFTDGSMGDMTFFFNVSYPGLIVDPLLDCAKLDNLLLLNNDSSSSSSSSCSCSVFSIGGGLPKHFAMRAAAHAAKSSSSGRNGTDGTTTTRRRRHFTSAVLITTTAPLTDGSVSAGTYEDDVSQFDLLNDKEHDDDDHEEKSESTTTKTELIHVRVEATLCVPFMTAMALF